MSEPLIRCRDLTKHFRMGSEVVRALDGVSLDIARGEFVAIMGPSGSGKSTLMTMIGALDTPTSGDIIIDGTALAEASPSALADLRGRTIGFVFQQFNLLPTLTAAENITFPLDLAGRKPDQEWLDHVVTAVGLGDRLSHKPSELSGGQQQRVAVARALVERPWITFADEPTGNLDSHSSAEILEFMRDAVDSYSQTMVMVTHDPVAAAYADRVLFLSDGRLVDELMEPTRDTVLAHVAALAG